MVDRIDDAAPSRVFTRLEWGEYLDWAAHPKARVFMDGRIEIYPDDVWQRVPRRHVRARRLAVDPRRRTASTTCCSTRRSTAS